MCASLFAAVTAQHRCNGQLVFAALDTISSRLQCTPVALVCLARIYYDCGDFAEVLSILCELLMTSFLGAGDESVRNAVEAIQLVNAWHGTLRHSTVAFESVE